MALPIIGALASIVSGLGSVVASSAAMFIAFKLFLTTLFVIALPIIFNNFLVSVIDTIMTKATSAVGSGATSHVVQLTGLSGYLADHLQLVLVVSILLGALSVRWTLKVLRLA